MRQILRSTFLLTLCLSVFSGGLQPATAWAADQAPSDKLLPPQVMVYFSIPDVPEFKERYESTISGLKEDEALADFRQELKAKVQELSSKVQKELDLTIEELLEIPSGEIAFAVVQPPGKSLAFLGMMDFGDHGETVDKLLDELNQSLKDEGAEQSVEEVAGTTINVFQFQAKKNDGNGAPGDGAPQQANKHEFAYFVKGTTLVGASSVAALESVLARWDGQHSQTFADEEVYQYILQRCRGERTQPLLTWYVNPIGLLQSALTSGQGNMQGAMMFMGFLPVLGIDGLKALGGTLDIDSGDYESIGRTFVYVEFPTRGLLKVFQFPETEHSPPDWVSADVTSYFSINWNVSTAYKAVETMVDSFQGPGTFAQAIDSMAQNEEGPGVHLKNDIIDHLNGRIHVVTDIPDPSNLQKQRALFALGLKNPDSMKSTLSSVAKSPQFPGETRDFRGETLYEVPMGQNLQGQQTTLGLAVTQGYLMIAVDVTILEQVMRADSSRKSLADTEEYQRIAEHFPVRSSMIGFQKQDAQFQAGYEFARSGQLSAFIQGIDFTTLPPFEEIREHLNLTSGSYAVPDERGAFFVGFSLKQEKN